MLIYNPTSQPIHIMALGSHFEFKPGQVKSVNDSHGQFISLRKGYTGLVSLPDVCIEAPDSKEAKEAKENCRKAGIEARVNYLKAIIANEEISLRQDLDKNNNKASIESHMSKGMKANYKELLTYVESEKAEQEKEAKELAAIREKLKQG